ncbi:Uma2 family endonuclease [Streptomyces sp. NPDC050844]|uniref:Uma2 family endonuclease n=1 Tax=Streptomyces sp. NPDC050844 TaxID=3155790 RepID=UPI0033C44DCA
MGAVMSAEAQVQATEDNWAFPPAEGWTFEQVKDLELPFDWELVDGMIVVRGRAKYWHGKVRDKISRTLENAQPESLSVVTESCVMLDEQNVRVPDVMVHDRTGLSFFEMECVPVAKLVLVVEVVSPGSRSVDRVHKPAEFAAAKVPYYWRVELERDNQLAVHEYWLNADTLSYFPAPSHPVHRRELATDFPYPVKIDLTELTRF